MLSKNLYELVVGSAMHRYAEKNDGEIGWMKKDIEEEIFALGGTQNDVYEAMKIGMDICLGGEKAPEYELN